MIDKRTGRPLGDHGTCLQAINYMLDHERDEKIEFLRCWREGNLDEWPEFYVWLKSESPATTRQSSPAKKERMKMPIRNSKNILALANLIESLPEDKFAMKDTLRQVEAEFDSNRSCGSPSCIAGWAAWEAQGRPVSLSNNGAVWDQGQNDLVNSALDYFGIFEPEERLRVMAKLFRGDFTDTENSYLTKESAVRALRHFAETGEIIWR